MRVMAVAELRTENCVLTGARVKLKGRKRDKTAIQDDLMYIKYWTFIRS